MENLSLLIQLVQQGAAIILVCLLLYGLQQLLSTRLEGDDEILNAMRTAETRELELRRRWLSRVQSGCETAPAGQ